jgi:hypothetical protein
LHAAPQLPAFAARPDFLLLDEPFVSIDEAVAARLRNELDPTSRSAKAFCHRCGRLVPDAHGAQSARDHAAIDPVAIADEVVRSPMAAMSGAWLCRKVRHPWLGGALDHVLGDARLRDFKPELEQFAADAWRGRVEV